MYGGDIETGSVENKDIPLHIIKYDKKFLTFMIVNFFKVVFLTLLKGVFYLVKRKYESIM